MDPLERLQGMLQTAWTQALERIADIFPHAALALLVLVAGLLLAVLVRYLLMKILFFFAVDKLAAKTQLEHILKTVGIRKSVSEILGLLFFWLIVLFTLVLASEILELPQITTALTVITGFIPRVIAAFLIIVFGMLLARFLQTLVVQSVGKTQMGYERTMGKAVNALVIFLALIAALEQLDIELSLVTTNFMIILSVTLFLLGAALIIGGRVSLENMIANQGLKQQLDVGDKVRILEYHGKVKAFTKTAVVLEGEGNDVVLPAKLFAEHTYTRQHP